MLISWLSMFSFKFKYYDFFLSRTKVLKERICKHYTEKKSKKLVLFYKTRNWNKNVFYAINKALLYIKESFPKHSITESGEKSLHRDSLNWPIFSVNGGNCGESKKIIRVQVQLKIKLHYWNLSYFW